MPTRESIEANRVLKPVAHLVLRPELWRFTRRSVPRGVALGMVTGILFPIAQIPLSALLALPVRANIPTAVAMTFITNPLTTPFFWLAAYAIGGWAMHFEAHVPVRSLTADMAAAGGIMPWLLSSAGPQWLLGMAIISGVFALVGYGASTVGWRWWIMRKRRRRVAKKVN